MSLLTIEQVSKTYQLRSGWSGQVRHFCALQNVSINVEPGICLGIVGESGAGKSTLGRIALGLERPDRGKVYFQGQDYSRFTAQDWRSQRRSMQVVFQDCFSAVNPRWRIQDIISEPLRNYGQINASQVKASAIELLETVGLTAADAQKYPHQFSGGQLQRVTIARAIALKPKLIVLDEPVSSLDMTTQAQILQLLRDLKQQYQLAYLFITHDLTAVSYLADRMAVMQSGAIVEALESVNFTQLQHPYSRQLITAQLPVHPRDRS
jgi:nickel transport system ATP-binding protein